MSKLWKVILYLGVIDLASRSCSHAFNRIIALAWFCVTFLAAYTFNGNSERIDNTGICERDDCYTGGINRLLAGWPLPIWLTLSRLAPKVGRYFRAGNMEAEVHWTGWEPGIGGGGGLLMVVHDGLGWCEAEEGENITSCLRAFSRNGLVFFLRFRGHCSESGKIFTRAPRSIFSCEKRGNCYVHCLDTEL